MNGSTFADCKRFYESRLQQHFGRPRGAKESQIAEIEQRLGMLLPPDFRSFLSWMGRDEDGFFVGSDAHIEDIEGNNEDLASLLTENGIGIDRTKPLVCFFMHQGYFAAWFHPQAGTSEPPVLQFSEASVDAGVTEEGVFGEWLMARFVDAAIRLNN